MDNVHMLLHHLVEMGLRIDINQLSQNEDGNKNINGIDPGFSKLRQIISNTKVENMMKEQPY